MQLPFLTSHILTVSSQDPEAISDPCGLNVQQKT